MSNIVVNKLSEFLCKVIKDYAKESLEVSLLKGEANLKDFNVDVDIINVYVEHYVPFLHINKLRVSDVQLKLPNYLSIKNKPTIVQIGHVEVDVTERDFTKPSALELNNGEWPMADAAPNAESTEYGIIQKVVDGVRVEIDSVHITMSFRGLPNGDATSDMPRLSKMWYGIDTDSEYHQKFQGEPLILEVWLVDCVFCQTNSKWETSWDIKQIRKEQGRRDRNFTVHKLFNCRSCNVHFVPNPNRKDRKQSPVFLLQNYPIDLKIILQRTPNGKLKSESLQWHVDHLNFYLTQLEYFELNYFIASLLYAQSKQYELNPSGKEYSHTKSETRSVTEKFGQSPPSAPPPPPPAGPPPPKPPSGKPPPPPGPPPTQRGKQSDSKEDDEGDDINAHHTNAGRNLFDTLHLCQPPAFKFDKVPKYNTVSICLDRLCINIMSDDWKVTPHLLGRDPNKRKRSTSDKLKQGFNSLKQKVRRSSIGSNTPTTPPTNASNIHNTPGGRQSSPLQKGFPDTKPVPPKSRPQRKKSNSSGGDRSPFVKISKMVGNESPVSHSETPPEQTPIIERRPSQSSGNLKSPPDPKHHADPISASYTDSHLGNEDRKFLTECNLRPNKLINKISIGDRYIYDNSQLNSLSRDENGAQGYVKPLVLAVFSEFNVGMLFPTMGYSLWRTKIGKKRAEQFFSIQIKDCDILADSDLKTEMTHKIKTGWETAVQQLKKEQDKMEKKATAAAAAAAAASAVLTPEDSEEKKEDGSASDDASGHGDTRQKKRNSTTSETYRKEKYLTLVVSSRHYKPQTSFEQSYKFTVKTPFQGYNADTLAVFNFQWTRRVPAPRKMLGSMTDLHLKPISIYFDPFLFYNITRFLAGNGVVRCYQMQAAISTSNFVDQRFATRYLLDAIKITIPLNEDSCVSAEVHGLRLSSHDKLDETAHLRGLVDLSNFSSIGTQTMQAMGLTDRTISRIHDAKAKYIDEQSGTDNFRTEYGRRLADIAPTTSAVLRPPDEYPWEIHIGHFQLASLIVVQDKQYDNDFSVTNLRTRFVTIRSESIDTTQLASFIDRPFVETQISIRIEQLTYNLDLAALQIIRRYLRFGDVLKLPIPALYSKVSRKVKAKVSEKQKQKFKAMNEEQKNIDQKLAQKSAPSLTEIEDKPDIREISISSSDSDDILNIEGLIDGVLDNIMPTADLSSKPSSPKRAGSVTPLPPNHNNTISDGAPASSEATEPPTEPPTETATETVSDGGEMDLRVAVYSNLDTAEFRLTSDGNVLVEGTSEMQQALLQYSAGNAVQIHLYGKRFDMNKCPFGSYHEKDVATRIFRDITGHSWIEVVHDQPNGALHLCYPSLFSNIVDNANEIDLPPPVMAPTIKEEKSEPMPSQNGTVINGNPPTTTAIGDTNDDTTTADNDDAESKQLRESNELHLRFIQYMLAENRAMQTKILQLASDLTISREDMRTFVEQTTEDKIRIVEHQQNLCEDNIELRKQVQYYQRRVAQMQQNRK